MVRRTRPGISRFRVRCGACHRAALCADPLASPRNDGVWVASLAMTSSPHTASRSRRDAPELCMNLSPKKTEGAGNAGCPLHPRPPLVGRDGQRSRGDLGGAETEIFLQMGLDWWNQLDQVQQIRLCAQAPYVG